MADIVSQENEPTASQVVAGMSAHPDRIQKAIDELRSGFMWSDSPEGFDFWVEVCSRLEGICRAARDLEKARKS